MKIRGHYLHPVDAVPAQKVLRIDDEIEVVVQDVDLKERSRPLKKELQKTIDQVWHRNSEWLGVLKPLALGGYNEVRGRRRRQMNPKLISPFAKDNPSSLSMSANASHSVLLAQSPADSQLCDPERATLTPKREMNPPNEVIVFSSDSEDFCNENDSTFVDCPANGNSHDLLAANLPSVVKGREASPASVVEIPTHKPVLTINIEDSEKGDELKSADVLVKSEPVRRVGLKRKHEQTKSKGRHTSELDRLYVSLKEIPWAQNWNPKTFLSRKAKTTYPRRETVIRKAGENNRVIKLVKKKPTVATSAEQVGAKGKAILKGKPAGDSAVLKKAPKQTKEKTLSSVSDVDGSQVSVSLPQVKMQLLRNKRVKPGVSKCVKTNVKGVPATATLGAVGKSGSSQKLSTNLAIRQYDASKMCKTKNGQRKKPSVLHETNGSSSESKHSSTTPCIASKNPIVKAGPSYKKTMPVLSVSAQVAVTAPYRKEHHHTSSCVEDPKPLVAVSPKILPFPSSPECNGFSGVRTEAAGVLTNSGMMDGRLGNEQLLQRQLVSVLGKDPSEAKKKLEDESLRYSIRQSECAFRYKEIAVKKHSNYIQIILVPNRTRHNGLTLEALHELREALISAKKDPTCKVLLLNSSGSIFCSGVDLASLVGHIHMPHKISQAIRSLIETLALFSKPVVAAVNGAAVGLGVTLLTYCDVVFASEKATFFTPYARLGHIPEGAMTLVLPQVVGSLVASDMLLRDRKLTAFQASIYGLVSEVIWPSQFMESIIPRVQAMANQSGQAMESTKVLLRYHQWDKLQSTLENESRLLPKQWLSPPCQQAIKQALEQPGGLIDW